MLPLKPPRIKGTSIRLIQLEDHSFSKTFYRTATEAQLTDFFQKGLKNVNIRGFDTQAFLETLDSTETRTLILSSLDFTSANNEKVTFVDFSQKKRTPKMKTNYLSVSHFLEDSSDIESLFFQVRYTLVKFVDPEQFVITKPYVDFTGDGEIVTMGFPGISSHN